VSFLHIYSQLVSTFTSAWILVLISLDRLIRITFPYQQRRLCTQKNAALFVSAVCICSITATSHVLQSNFSFAIEARLLCGPPRTNLTDYAIFYYHTWPILQLCLTYFIPSCLMIVALVFIYKKIRV
jgi:hypothetical protein